MQIKTILFYIENFKKTKIYQIIFFKIIKNDKINFEALSI